MWYRHHPLYGQEVRVYRHFPPDGAVIILPDDTKCILPGWMLNEEACGHLVDEQRPRISLSVLIAVRELLDAQPLSPRTSSVSSGTFTCSGANHEQNQGTSDAASVPAGESVGAVAGRSPSRVSQARKPTAIRSRPIRTEVKEDLQ